MFEWALLIIGVLGLGAAGYLDLKTTEFPDWLPYATIVAALAVRGLASFFLADFNIIIGSIVVGLVFLGIGYLLYFTRQWGDGDAWLLGVMGFLFPIGSFATIIPQRFPFPLTLIFNFFLISFFYLIGYSIIVGFRNPKAMNEFKKSLKLKYKGIVSIVGFFSVLTVLLVYFMYEFYGIGLQFTYTMFWIPVLLLFVLVFINYGKVIESTVFRKRIDASELRVGDVPLTDKWRVLKPAEVKALKEKGGSVCIKEGVRLAPVFVITLVVSLFIGNLFLLII
ncbi:MAG: prepilin peptidase [Candidatus Aenigmarchaeota archaeon]|nr:prepilin peptidase [Candidatus Aenigmarchaeota archaeon]